MKKLLPILFLIPSLLNAQVYFNRFTTNQEPIATRSIDGIVLTNISMPGVTGLTNTLTNLLTGKFDATNGIGYGTNVFHNATVRTNLVVTNDLTVGNNIDIGQDLNVGNALLVNGSSSFQQSVVVNETITFSNLDGNRATYLDGSGQLAVSSTTDTELGYVNGVTGPIQTQLAGKQSGSLNLTNWSGIVIGSKLDTTNGIAFTSLVQTNSAGFIQRYRGNGTALHETQFQFNGNSHWNQTVTSNDITWLDESLNEVLAITNGGNAGFYKNLALGGNLLAGTNATINSNLFVGGRITATNLTASRLLVSDANKQITNSTVTATEAGFLSGLTNNVQTNLNYRIPNTGGSGTNTSFYQATLIATGGTLEIADGTEDSAAILDGDRRVTGSVVSTDELYTLNGVNTASNLSAQLNAKLDNTQGIFTNSLTGKGHLSVQSNSLLNNLTVTNNMTNGGNIYLTGALFTTLTNYSSHALVTNTLTVRGVMTATNSQLRGLTMTGNTTNAGAVQNLYTNITGAVDGNNNLNIGSIPNAYISGTVTSSWNLCSLQGGVVGLTYFVVNASGQSMTLVNESGFAASAADRFAMPGGANVTLPNYSVFYAHYNTNLSRWNIGVLGSTNDISGFIAKSGGFGTNLTIFTNLTITNASGDAPRLDFKASAGREPQQRFSYNGVASWLFNYASNVFTIINFDDTEVFALGQDGNVSLNANATLTVDTTTISGSSISTQNIISDTSTASVFTDGGGFSTDGSGSLSAVAVNATSSITTDGGLVVKDYQNTSIGANKVRGILSTNATLDFGSAATGVFLTLTTPLAGVGTNGNWVLSVTPQTHIKATTGATNLFDCWVSATNTVSVMFQNRSAATIDPPSGKYSIIATKTADD